jgi:hypothetical protein
MTIVSFGSDSIATVDLNPTLDRVFMHQIIGRYLGLRKEKKQTAQVQQRTHGSHHPCHEANRRHQAQTRGRFLQLQVRYKKYPYIFTLTKRCFFYIRRFRGNRRREKAAALRELQQNISLIEAPASLRKKATVEITAVAPTKKKTITNKKKSASQQMQD